MKSNNKFQHILLTTALLGFLSACSQTPVAQEFPATASARDEVSKLELDMSTALENQFDVLSPSNFKKALSYTNDAKKNLDKQRDAKDTLEDVAKGRAYLKQANEFAKIAQSNLEDVILARRQAIKAGARQMRAKEFAKIDDDLVDVTKDIEKNDLRDAAKMRSTLQLTYLDLELQSIKQGHIGPARDTINLAVKEGAKNFAPRMLAVAEKSFTDTEAYITGNRHDESQINARSIETMKRAQHLLKITRDSRQGNKTSSEDTALQMEGEQNNVVQKQAQLNAKQGQLDDKVDELAMKQTQVNMGKDANAALALENSSLETEQAFSKSFENAQREFTQNEAEVYKQGNKLMIRLRGLEFPSAQAVLKSSNFPLLAKVQKVIKTFGHSSVVVEGHTDSNGGKALNQELSVARAQAVKDYLTTNNSDQLTKITSVGYGYQKPLATNKTPAGRAQNRRVDILIEPETATR